MVSTAVKEAQGRIWIPKISETELSSLSARVRQVILSPEGSELYYVAKPLDPHLSLRNPTPVAKATDDLEYYSTIETYHAILEPNCFIPTLDEVLAQIPKSDIGKVVAFKIIENFESEQYPEALTAGFHPAKTVLYTAKK